MDCLSRGDVSSHLVLSPQLWCTSMVNCLLLVHLDLARVSSSSASTQWTLRTTHRQWPDLLSALDEAGSAISPMGLPTTGARLHAFAVVLQPIQPMA